MNGAWRLWARQESSLGVECANADEADASRSEEEALPLQRE